MLSDALNHTSIVAGVKASGGVVKVFRHNNVQHLERLLRFHIAEGQPRTHRPWKKVRRLLAAPAPPLPLPRALPCLPPAVAWAPRP